ncbi:MAG: M14 family metallopeptidase [Acidimicrobiales bacterium]
MAAAGSRAVRSVFGRSVRGRDLVAVTVAAPRRCPGDVEARAVVLGNIHGNEVVSSELALAVLEDLCATDLRDDVVALLAVADVTVVPALNVDGRDATFAGLDRTAWFVNAPRRNANLVDLNRNWPWPAGARDHWLPIAGVRTTRLPWSRGSHPLSEPETAAFEDLLASRPPFALLNLHSTGQIITWPWSSKAEPPADVAAFRAMAEAFRAAQTRWRYRAKQSRAWYPIVGSSDDHFYDRWGTLAVTIETDRPGAAVRSAPLERSRWHHAFWWANPSDLDAHIDNNRAACVAALRSAAQSKGVASAGASPCT